MTEKERIDTKIAMIYELRLFLKENQKNGKTEYTVDELFDLLDNAAAEKEKDT